jgi:heat-inducible transcriptional repressor
MRQVRAGGLELGGRPRGAGDLTRHVSADRLILASTLRETMVNERELMILRLVVDAYVRDGAPVSSQAVRDADSFLSTASIRNVMAKLEEEGYLAKTHTSSGRVPTDVGYRAYVDHLEGRTRFGGEFVPRFRDELRELDLDVGSVMGAASRVLGILSKHFAVIYGGVIQESRVRRVRLIELEGARLLVVVNLVPDRERTIVMRLEKPFAADVFVRAEEWINRLVGGRTLVEAKDILERAVRDNVTDEGIITREVSIRREDIFSEPPAVELFFEERGHLMDEPELSDPRLLQILLRLLHNKPLLSSVMSRRLGEQTQITIGSENEEQELRSFSLVTAGYRLGAARGVLGVIGPTRMRYAYVRDLVGSAARELRAFGEQYY